MSPSHPRARSLSKGGDPAAPSGTATLLRLHPSHESHRGRRSPLRVGFPHSEIRGSKLVCQLPAAYRRLRRPSSPVIAKASTTCTLSLDPITVSPLLRSPSLRTQSYMSRASVARTQHPFVRVRHVSIQSSNPVDPSARQTQRFPPGSNTHPNRFTSSSLLKNSLPQLAEVSFQLSVTARCTAHRGASCLY